MTGLDSIEAWDTAHASVGVVRRGEVVAVRGSTDRSYGLASVTKILVAYAALIGVEEGTVALEQPAGPPGSTVRHLLSHASGLAFDAIKPVTTPASRRIYSNAGYEVLGRHLTQMWTMSLSTYVHEALFEPLHMTGASLPGSPASGGRATLADLLRFAVELQRPKLVAPATLAAATAVQFPGLAGVLPGFGSQTPCDWGLGFELRDAKRPHWTGTSNSPATFGHFGASGTFLWVDPAAELGCAVLTDRAFGPWAVDAWPALSDDVLAAFG